MTTDKKKAKQFISALARNIVGDVDTEAAFSAAIRKLPLCELKKILLKNVEKYYTKLQQKLEKNSKTQEEDAEEIKAAARNDFQYPYNLFHRNRLNIKKGSLDELNIEKESVLCCNLLCQRLPRVTDEELGQLVSSTQNAKKKKGKGQLSWLFDLLEQLTGVTDTAAVQKVIKYCFSQTSEVTEALLEKKEIKKMQSVKEDLHNILCFCHVKRQQLSGKSAHPSVEDIMAALASIYLDLCLVIARHEDCNKKKLSRQLCSFCCLLFQHSQQHLMDVVLQQSAVTSDDLDLAMPFYRKIFTVLSTGENRSYTKYMAGVRQVAQWFGGEAVTDILQNAKQRPSPSGYVDWLREEDGSIVDEMPDTRFFQGSQVTQFLLDEASQDLLDRMLDLVADSEESEVEETEDVHTQGQEKGDGGSLFFIDKAAPQKTSFSVQEEVHEDAAKKINDDGEVDEEEGMSSESDSDQEIPSSTDEEEETESKVPFIHTDILKQTEKAIDTALSEAAVDNAEMLVDKMDEEEDEEEMDEDDSEDDDDDESEDDDESGDDDEQEEDGEDSETKESETFSEMKLEKDNAVSPRLQSLKFDQDLVDGGKGSLINGSSETSSSHDLEQDDEDSDSVVEGEEAHKVITRSKLKKPAVDTDVTDIEIAITRQLRQLRKRQSVAPEQNEEDIPPKKKAENTPKSTIRTPKAGDKTPKTSGKTPLSIAKTPNIAGKTPLSIAKTPNIAGKTPKSAAETPKAAGKTPVSTTKTQKVGNKTPKAIGATPKTPVSSTKTPKTAGKTPKSVGKTPKPVDKTPRSLDKTPKSVKKASDASTADESKDTPRKKSSRLSLVSHKRLAEVREELADSSHMILRKRQNSESETERPRASVYDFHSDMSDLDLTPKKNQKTNLVDSDKLKKVRRATLSGDLPVRKTPKQDDDKKKSPKVTSDIQSPNKNLTPRSANRRRSTRLRNTPKKLQDL